MLLRSPTRRISWNTLAPVYLAWSATPFASLLSFSLSETNTAFPSTDPVGGVVGALLDYQGSQPIYGTPYLLRFTSSTLSWADSFLSDYQTLHMINQSDVSDSIIFENIVF
jgi:hypothetical protein